MLHRMLRIGLKSLCGFGLGLALACALGCSPAVVAPVASAPPQIVDWTITVTFNYNFTNFVPCSTTVTVGCISGFTWGYTEGTTNVPLKTSPATICTGTTQPETCTDTANSTLGIGTWNAYVQANGVNNSGTAVTSTTDVSPSYTVTIGTPTNVTATAE